MKANVSMWSTSDILLLIKAVTDEEKIMIENHGKSVGLKWDRIVSRLPPGLPQAFREKSPGGDYKCRIFFYNYIRKTFTRRHDYKTMTTESKRLTEQIEELLAKREDLSISRARPRATSWDHMSPSEPASEQTREVNQVLVIKAVMQVEEEIRNRKTADPSRKSSVMMSKWERVASLLPPGLNKKLTGKPGASHRRDYNCRRIFVNVLRKYRRECRVERRRSCHNGSAQGTLSKVVRELLKMREDIINAATSTPPHEQSKASGGQYLSEQSHASHDSAEVPSHAVSHAFKHVNADELLPAQSMKRNYVISSVECASATVGASRHEYSDSEDGLKNPPRSEHGRFSWKSLREVLKQPDDLNAAEPGAEPSARPGLQPRCFIRKETGKETDATSSPRPQSRPRSNSPANNFRGCRPKRKNATSMAHASDARSDDEHNDHEANLDESLRKIDRRFLDLCSWVQRRSIPGAITMLRERTTAGKCRKVNPTTEPIAGPFDDLIHENRRKRMDLQICAVFETVKIRFAKELKNAVVELAEEVPRGTY